MFELLEKINWKNAGTFAGGVLFGTAGIRVLSGKGAKKAYTHTTAAVLRARDCIMDRVTIIQENAEDIYARALQINEEREDSRDYEDLAEDGTEVE